MTGVAKLSRESRDENQMLISIKLQPFCFHESPFAINPVLGLNYCASSFSIGEGGCLILSLQNPPRWQCSRKERVNED